MAKHLIPQQLVELIVADLVSRVAEFGANRPAEVGAALSILKALPEIAEGTELEIDWYSEHPPESATFNLTSSKLCLTLADEDGSRDVYECDAGFYPRIDSDLNAWISRMRSISCPEITISCWLASEGEEPADEEEGGMQDVVVARLNHENFTSCVTLSLDAGGALRMHVYDTGAAPDMVFGSDYDRWVDILPAGKNALLVALLMERFRGNIDAVGEFRDFCERTGVPHRYNVY